MCGNTIFNKRKSSIYCKDCAIAIRYAINQYCQSVYRQKRINGKTSKATGEVRKEA